MEKGPRIPPEAIKAKPELDIKKTVSAFLAHENTFEKLTRRQKRFLGIVNELPPEAQDFINGLSSTFMEIDRYFDIKNSLESLQEIEAILKDQGLNESKINIVFNYFNLPFRNSHLKHKK